MQPLAMSKAIDDLHAGLKKFKQVKKDFVANVSHELRTPLTVIRGYLETLLNNDHPPPDELDAIFHSMLRQSLRMEHIVEDLLLLSKLEAKTNIEADKQIIDVPHILTLYCQDIKKTQASKAHEITLSVDPTLSLLGHEEELKSVFSNIIMNAIKYTPTQGHIDISWQQVEGCPVFSVTDNGIGIDPADIKRITERFYRVDKGRSRESGGTGLGLSIVKHILSRHQAKLLITSELGVGSVFTCHFPRTPPAPSLSPALPQ